MCTSIISGSSYKHRTSGASYKQLHHQILKSIRISPHKHACKHVRIAEHTSIVLQAYLQRRTCIPTCKHTNSCAQECLFNTHPSIQPAACKHPSRVRIAQHERTYRHTNSIANSGPLRRQACKHTGAWQADHEKMYTHSFMDWHECTQIMAARAQA
jgi:hypothetical protein